MAALLRVYWANFNEFFYSKRLRYSYPVVKIEGFASGGIKTKLFLPRENKKRENSLSYSPKKAINRTSRKFGRNKVGGVPLFISSGGSSQRCNIHRTEIDLELEKPWGSSGMNFLLLGLDYFRRSLGFLGKVVPWGFFFIGFSWGIPRDNGMPGVDGIFYF